MPFPISFTYQAQKQMLLCIAIAALLLLGAASCRAWSPALFRILLWSGLFYALATSVPRFSRWNWTLPAGCLALYGLYRMLTGPVAAFIDVAHPTWTPRRSNGTADVIVYHFSSVQDTLLSAGQSFFASIWLRSGEWFIAALLASLLWIIQPAVRRMAVRRAPNKSFQSIDLLLHQLPANLAYYLRTEMGLAAVQMILWTLAWELLGFRYPLFLGFLSAAGYWTPYFGANLAALFAIFFTGDVRELPWQLAGILIVMALQWLVKNYLWDRSLNKSRPHMATGLVLLLCLTGFALAGVWGLLLTVPLFSLSLLAAVQLQTALSLHQHRKSA